MKRLINLLLLLATTQISIAQSGEHGPLMWVIADGTLTISGNGAMPNLTLTGSQWNTPANRALFNAVVMEYGVTSIADNAFRDNPNLTSVIIPNSVTSIGQEAFRYSSNLTIVIIPNSVTSIGREAFNGSGLTSLIIPNSVISIGAHAFIDINLEKFVIEDCTSTLVFEFDLFFDTSIDSVYMGRNIEGGTFSHLGLRRLAIGNLVTSIPNFAFSGNSSLVSVTIGYNVATIGANAFNGATNLAIVTSLRPTPPEVSGNTFTGISGACLRVPMGSTNAYQTATGWGVFSSCITELDGDVPHTVIFNSMGGSSVATRFVTDGETMTKPTSPNRTEYGFAGWYREIEFINRWDFDTDVVTSDITLFAKWISFVSLFDSIAKLNIENIALRADTAQLRQLLMDCEYDLVETRHALSLRIDTINYQRDTILKLRLQLEICNGNNENSNTEILEITVEGLETAREGTNFSITANCGQDEVNIVIVADDPQATVEINGIEQNAITLDLDLHGDNVFTIKITAPNGDYSIYTLTVNRPIPFEQITIIRWGQAVSVINNPENNGGYVFNSFRWFRNDDIEPFSTSQWWSANAIDNPNPDDIFRVEVVTAEGRTLRSCHEIVVLNTAEINLFPNPALVGQTFYVEVDIHEDFLQNAMLTVYNAMGVRQGQLALQGQLTPVNLNLSAGVHVVVLSDSQGFRKEIKTVVR